METLHTDALQDLARLRALEGSVRRLRIALVLVGLFACVAPWIMGASATQPEVRTNRLVLLDESGKERARLSVEAVDLTAGEIGPRLQLFGERENHPSVALFAGKDLASVHISDPKGKGRISLEMRTQAGANEPRLIFYGRGGRESNDVHWEAPCKKARKCSQ